MPNVFSHTIIPRAVDAPAGDLFDGSVPVSAKFNYAVNYSSSDTYASGAEEE